MKNLIIAFVLSFVSFFGLSQTTNINVTDTYISGKDTIIETSIGNKYLFKYDVNGMYTGQFVITDAITGDEVSFNSEFQFEFDGIQRSFEIRTALSDTNRSRLVTFKSSTLSTDDNIKIEFLVYPNPTVDILNVKVDNYDGLFQVVDMSGRVVTETESKSIDVSNLTSGKYLLKVGTSTKIFIKN